MAHESSAQPAGPSAPDGAGAVISLRDLRVGPARRPILTIDALEVPDGQMLAILGANGAGKTTLLRALLGLVRFAGQVRVLGEPVGRLGGKALAALRCRVGYVPQLLGSHAQLPLTVREVVAIGRSGLRGLGRRLTREDWALVDRWCERLGLADLACARYADCSGGEQRRALIAKAMVQQPAILLLDEPTANLDLATRERVVQLLASLHQAGGLTVMLVCHELEVLPPHCPRVVMLQQGCLIGDGAPGQVLSPERVDGLYGTHLRLVSSGGRWSAIPAGLEEARP